MEAWSLAQQPERIAALIEAKQWHVLIPLADAIAADAPKELAATDPALFRTLRKAFTELRVRGLALDPAALRKLAGEQS